MIGFLVPADCAGGLQNDGGQGGRRFEYHNDVLEVVD